MIPTAVVGAIPLARPVERREDILSAGLENPPLNAHASAGALAPVESVDSTGTRGQQERTFHLWERGPFYNLTVVIINNILIYSK